MERDTRQYLAENRIVFADVAAALCDGTDGCVRADRAPSTPWDAPGVDDMDAARAVSKAAARRGEAAAGSAGAGAEAFPGGFASGFGSENLARAKTSFEAFAKERERERVKRVDSKGASVTVRRGGSFFGPESRDESRAGDGDGAGDGAGAGERPRRMSARSSPPLGSSREETRLKIKTTAPVANLDRFPSFPGPGTARSAAAARARAEAARRLAERSNERKGWSRFLWGFGVEPAGLMDEDVGEIGDRRAARERGGSGEVPVVVSEASDSESSLETETLGSEAVGTRGAAAAGAPDATGNTPFARAVSVKSWLDDGEELVSGWDADAAAADDDDAADVSSSRGNGFQSFPRSSPKTISGNQEVAPKTLPEDVDEETEPNAR
jgi:hypothetical protein